MAGYQGISPSIFDEPEYRDSTELLIAIYIITRRDMLGVCPFRPSTVATACRTTTRKINQTADYFAKIDKVKMGLTRSHLWLKSGLYHSLYKGRYSLTQLSSATALLLKWHCSGVFGDCFAEEVVQLYGSKYLIVIPYPYPTPTPPVQSYTQSESDIQSESESDIHLEIVEIYHNLCPSLSKVLGCKDSRLISLKGWIKEYPDIEWWRTYFKRIEASDWLTGRSPDGKGWRADFDWILKPAKLRKIIEGGYDNRSRKRKEKTNAGHTSGQDYGPVGEIEI